MKTLKMALLLFLALGARAAEPSTISSYIGKLKVGQPIRYKNLAIYPLTSQQAKTREFITLAEAMDRGWLKIREIGDGEVNHVELKNSGTGMVFIMTGEMLKGAKQDRMLGQDVLVPPKSAWIRVPVYCVEHGRWVSSSPTFKASNEVAPNALRQCARITENQSDVWDAIASSQDKLGIVSGTSTVHANYEDEKIKKELAGYTGHFERLPRLDPSTVGVVVATGDRILCVDIFADNKLLSKFWARLLRSYAMDAIMEHEPTVDKAAIKDLMLTLSKSKYVSLGTPGAGELHRMETSAGRGSALVHDGKIIHLDFFVDDLCDSDQTEWQLDIRRDQRLND